MRILFRQVKSNPKNWLAIADEVKKAIDEQVKPDLLSYFNRIVKSWEHKPTFEARKIVSKGNISVYVYPTGENAKYWLWVTLGTPKREIVPRADNPTGLLFFRVPYTPKTSQGGHYGGPGTYGNELVVAKKVTQHEIKGRHFEQHTARWYKSKHTVTIRAAIRRGNRKTG